LQSWTGRQKRPTRRVPTIAADETKTGATTAKPQPPVTGELNEKEQLAVLHVLAQIDNDYLQQIAADGMSAQRMRRAINRVRKALEAQTPAQPKPTEGKARPSTVTSNTKTKANSAAAQ